MTSLPYGPGMCMFRFLDPDMMWAAFGPPTATWALDGDDLCDSEELAVDPLEAPAMRTPADAVSVR